MKEAGAPLSRMIAEFARELRLEDIPPAVLRATKDHILDALGVGLAAASLRSAAGLRAAAAALGQGAEASALGFAEPLPAPSAALLNGALIHSLEFDDTHIASVVHGSSVVVPTALAVAEREGRSGRDLLRAVVIGWEVFVRLGLAAPGRFQARGFQITAVGGPFVAALIGSTLLDADAAQTVSALGIAGSQSSGVFEYLSDGSTVKSLHPGWAAHAGTVASYLARGGMTGPSSIFDGRFGFYATFAGDVEGAARLREMLRTLGRDWHLPEVSLKAYPCCHYIHPFLECLSQVLADGVAVDDIAEIRCEGPREEAPVICEPWERKLAPASGYEAKFSLPYCLGALLADGAVDVSTFDIDSPDPKALALASRVVWTPQDGTGFPRRFPGRIEVRMESGRRRAAHVADVHGGPDRPLPPVEIRAKFRKNAARRLRPEAVSAVEAAVDRLDAAPDLTELCRALTRHIRHDEELR